jgi:hypothetical protein
VSHLSGPAVEDKGLLELAEPFWKRINTVAARSLGRSARGFLPPDPRREERLLGCGAWGCVWLTSDKKFVVKVTLDATEGPIVAQIMNKRNLRLNPGCTYYHRIWQFPDLVWTNAYGYAPAYVILREEVGRIGWLDERGDVRRKYSKIYDSLEALPDASCDLVRARADLEHCRTIRCANTYVAAEKAFMEYVVDLRETSARHVGTFMAQAYANGVLLGDVHPGNVGMRRHNLKKFGVPVSRTMVVADVGDEGQAVCPEDDHPGVKVLKNPYHPRHPSVMAYWASRIPVL